MFQVGGPVELRLEQIARSRRLVRLGEVPVR